MKVQHLIGKLRYTQQEMRDTAAAMRRAGIAVAHADELAGAANIIDSWIEGIDAEADAGVKGPEHG
jgi:hypothetical protein